MPVLLHKRPDGTERRVEIGSKPAIIGRLPESEIQVRDGFISRVHAGIGHANGSFTLKDLGSTNGTYRNGARVFECNLANGDKVQVGNATLVFELDASGKEAVLRQIPQMTTAPRPLGVPGAASGEKILTVPVKPNVQPPS